MQELWIGAVEVLTEPSIGSGNTRAFTNVVTWAGSASEFVSSVTAVFAEYGRTVLSRENERPVARETGYSEEISEIIERAKMNPRACIFATFNYYPSKPT
jgi:hypothetical protein